jgi:hypothetical protein
MKTIMDVRNYLLRLEQAVVAYAITCEMYECALTSMASDFERMAAEHAIIPDPGMADALHRLRVAAGAVAEKFPLDELGICHTSVGEV